MDNGVHIVLRHVCSHQCHCVAVKGWVIVYEVSGSIDVYVVMIAEFVYGLSFQWC